MNYVDWYNNHRLHSLCDLGTPEEFEQVYYAHDTGSGRPPWLVVAGDVAVVG